MHRNGFWEINKYKVGCGGIVCVCCTKMPPTELKMKYRRTLRRKVRQQMHLEALNA